MTSVERHFAAAAGSQPKVSHARQGSDDLTIRVMIADDHQVLREGLVSLLSDEPGIRIVGQARDGLDAVEQARSLKPDVIIMDISMPRLDGIEATRRIVAELERVGVVALSMHESDDMARAMMDAGAVAYLTKGSPMSELVAAIRRAMRG